MRPRGKPHLVLVAGGDTTEGLHREAIGTRRQIAIGSGPRGSLRAMGWPFAYMIGVPASTSSGSVSRSSHTRAIPGASAGICACALGTSPGGAQAAGASRQTPSKARLMRWYFMIRMMLPSNVHAS